MGIDTVELSKLRRSEQRKIDRGLPVILGVAIAGTWIGMQYVIEHYQPRIYISRPFLEEGLKMKEPTIEQFFMTYDLNSDGLVDENEYKIVVARDYDKVRF